MRNTLTLGITIENDVGQSKSVVQVSVPVASLCDESHVLSAVRQCRMQLDRLHLAEEVPMQAQPPTPRHQRDSPRLATTKQVNAILAMAKRQGVELDRTLHDRFGVSSLAALSIGEASSLIDELKNNLQSA